MIAFDTTQRMAPNTTCAYDLVGTCSRTPKTLNKFAIAISSTSVTITYKGVVGLDYLWPSRVLNSFQISNGKRKADTSHPAFDANLGPKGIELSRKTGWLIVKLGEDALIEIHESHYIQVYPSCDYIDKLCGFAVDKSFRSNEIGGKSHLDESPVVDHRCVVSIRVWIAVSPIRKV